MQRSTVGAAFLSLALHAAPISAAAGDGGTAPAPDAGEDAGQVAFNTHCRNCHSSKPDDNRLGPTLHNIVGAKAGQVKGFGNYSGGLTADMTWDEATLDKFIASPTAMVPNTTMKPFGGVADAEQRKLIIEFLKTQTGS
jgi:cytochrome c